MRRFKNNYEKNRNLQKAQRGGDREPPQPAVKTPDPVEELLRERPELEASGVDWGVASARKRVVNRDCQGYA